MSDDKQAKATIWTGAATTSPVLARLDKKAPLISKEAAKRRAAQLRERIKRDLVPFTSRSIAESLRKLVK
jgi:hypothetical protein